MILERLPRLGVAPTADAASLEVASRTDRGVSARANALALTSRLPGPALLRALNGLDPAIFFTAARAIPPSFSVRTAALRSYRYFEPIERHDLARWKTAAALFRNYVDIRSFGRDVPASTPVWRLVTSVKVTRRGGMLAIDLQAPAFVWGMVRKIVASLRAYDAGTLSLVALHDAIDGRRRLTLPLAEPERLLLWEVRYEGDWDLHASARDGHYRRAAAEARQATAVRGAILDQLWPELPPGVHGRSTG